MARHPLTQMIFTELCDMHGCEVLDEHRHKVDGMIRSYLFRDELRRNAEEAIKRARVEAKCSSFPPPPDYELMIVIEEAVKLYGQR